MQITQSATDGKCGVHACVLSLRDVALQHRTLSNKNVYKQRMKHKNSDDSMIAFVRNQMVSWMREHKDDEVWAGFSFGQLALAMATENKRSFGEYLLHMAKDKTRIDASGIHAGGCVFGMDFAIFQCGMDPAVVGSNFHCNHTGAPATILGAIAMVNDLHFWAILPLLEFPSPKPSGYNLPICTRKDLPKISLKN